MNPLIVAYLDGIIKQNEKVNMTTITDWDEALLLHIEDSLAVLPELMDAPDGLYIDIGSGGGFPGVPLAIESGRNTVLVDSVKKKMNAVDEVLRALNLTSQIKAIHSRIEDLPYKSECSAVTARALAKMPSLMELASPLLQQYGRLICLKSHTEDELDDAIKVAPLVGMKLHSRRQFTLSDRETYREVIVFEKVAEPTIQLPRRNGLAQKKPLI